MRGERRRRPQAGAPRSAGCAWPARNAGFSLIELMAVITLQAVVTAMVMPQLRWNRARGVRAEAEALADLLEAARSRAVVTGRAHRVRLDFAESSRRLEWRPPVEPEPQEPAQGRERVDLEPPRSVESEFEPVPGATGNRVETRRGVWLLDLDSAAARELGDVVSLQFGPEGNADAARIVLGDDDGGTRWVVEIYEFAEDVDVYAEDQG